MKIEVLVGTICSGKSTWCKTLAQEGWIVINDDAIVNAVHANNYTLYKKELKPLYKSIEDHIFHTAIAMGKNVVIDRGLNNSIHSRKRWLALAKTLDTPIGAVVFPVWKPEEHARRRIACDGRGHDFAYWLKVAERHLNDWETPTLEEGFDYIDHYQWREVNE
jgi:predicted kinase